MPHFQPPAQQRARDHRPYHFEYIHRPWGKQPAIRQIIVRATNPRGKTVQLSVLTDDTQRPPSESVHLRLTRKEQISVRIDLTKS